MSQLVTITLSYHGTDLDVEGYYTPGEPGKVTGPWEDCYPEEPSEFEVEDILIEGGSIYDLLSRMQVAQNTSPIRHKDVLTDIAELACQYCDNTPLGDDGAD